MIVDKDSIAVITGAASGIGQALAVRFADERVGGLAISDVDEQGLAKAKELIEDRNVPVSAHVVDVSDRDAVKRFADDAVAYHGRITHLINNAGVGLVGAFEHISIEDFEWLMSINFWGVVYNCKYFLPILTSQPDAHIVNVSSVFGLIAPAEQAAYAASKFAVRGFTESLRHELADTNVSVSCVHPGGIKTNIARNARLGAEAPEEWKAQGAKFFDRVAKTTTEEAAETILKGINAGRERILIGRDAKAINIVSRLFPVKYLPVLEWLNGHKMSLRKK